MGLIEEESQSTFAKLGSKLSSFFGSSKEEEEKIETSQEQPERKDETKDEGKILHLFRNLYQSSQKCYPLLIRLTRRKSGNFFRRGI